MVPQWLWMVGGWMVTVLVLEGVQSARPWVRVSELSGVPAVSGISGISASGICVSDHCVSKPELVSSEAPRRSRMGAWGPCFPLIQVTRLPGESCCPTDGAVLNSDPAGLRCTARTSPRSWRRIPGIGRKRSIVLARALWSAGVAHPGEMDLESIPGVGPIMAERILASCVPGPSMQPAFGEYTSHEDPHVKLPNTLHTPIPPPG